MRRLGLEEEEEEEGRWWWALPSCTSDAPSCPSLSQSRGVSDAISHWTGRREDAGPGSVPELRGGRPLVSILGAARSAAQGGRSKSLCRCRQSLQDSSKHSIVKRLSSCHPCLSPLFST